MLREGAFTPISSGASFYDGSSLSLLLPDTEADDTLYGVQDGQVWQSAYREWVYESGVPIDGTNLTNPPFVASGVYIEGAFRATDDAEFGHVIDYINGRIIFNSPQPLELEVHAAFCARDVRVDFEHKFNQQYNEVFLESKYTTNPLTSYQLVYPSGKLQSFPAVMIEVDDRSFTAFELGNRSALISDTIKFHVWALDDLSRDNIVDIISSQWRKTVPIIDFNIAPLPLSGIYNTLSSEYIPYQNLLRNNTVVTTIGSGVPIRYLNKIQEVEVENMGGTEEFEYSIVTFTVETELNAPITPLGHYFGAINRLGPIGNSLF